MEKKVKYVRVTSNTSSKLFQNNYVSFWNDIKKDLLSWGRLQLSPLGKLSVIVINVLPKILFLFQTLLILMKPRLHLSKSKEIFLNLFDKETSAPKN